MAYELMAIPCEGEHNSRNITIATDVWAFGLTALEVRCSFYFLVDSKPMVQILSGQIPFYWIQHDCSVILFVSQGHRPPHDKYPQVDQKIWLLLDQCWGTDRPPMKYLALQLRKLYDI